MMKIFNFSVGTQIEENYSMINATGDQIVVLYVKAFDGIVVEFMGSGVNDFESFAIGRFLFG